MVEPEDDEEQDVRGKEADELRVIRGHPKLVVLEQSVHRSGLLNCVLQYLVQDLVQHQTSEECYLKERPIKNSQFTTIKRLTVCRSRLKSISVTNPAPMAIGAKLIHARSSPKVSPEKKIFNF